MSQGFDGLSEGGVAYSDFQIEVPDGRRVNLRHYHADQDVVMGVTYVLAPGASLGHDSTFIVEFARRLASHGLDVITFNFPFLQKGSKRPDSNQSLRGCYQRVLDCIINIEAVRTQPILAGGKCLGGLIASYIASGREGFSQPVAGLIFLGYPLHPPQRPEQLRAVHLFDITVPMLFVQGTRDPFGNSRQLEPVVNSLTVPANLYPVMGGDHGFCLPPKWETSNPQLRDQIAYEIIAWVRKTVPSPLSA